MRIEPSKPPSSSPTAWSRVDLPEPDGPSRATISPAPTARSTPRSTSMTTPAWTKLRLRPRTASTSFIAQHLDRIGLGGTPGGNQGGKEAQHQRHRHDRGHLDRVGARGQLGQHPHRRIPEVLPGQPLEEIDHRLAVIKPERAEDHAGE